MNVTEATFAPSPQTEEHDLDPILARVLSRAFESTCTEMGSAMIRTAVSAVFVEGRDFSCALLDDQAELVAAANYDPSHLSAMSLTAEYALMELGWENLQEGDVIVVNDPYRGGGHLPDICVIRPIYANGVRLGLAINRGHHIDVGGMSVAGFPGTARSVHQEGVRIPPVKWFEGGVEREQVMDLVLLNVRFPRAQLGDFRGQLASCITAEERIRELVDRHGLETVRAAMQETKDYSEKLMRHAIEQIPDGSYRFSDVMDDDGVGNGPYRINVEIRVNGSDAVVDFSGTSRQAMGPVNSSYGNTVGSVFNAFMHTFGDEIPFNQGCFRPVGFRVPRGSLLNPIPPAPVFGGVTETSIRIIDSVFGALAKAVPEKVAAGCYGTCINVAGGGWDEDRGEEFGVYFFQEGGYGATSWRDGWTSVPNPTSNFNDYPAEVVESTLPILVREIALNEDSGGPGRHRGGLGTRRTYELLADSCDLNALGDRFKFPPWGLEGGQPGRPATLLIQRTGSDEWRRFDEDQPIESPSKFSGVTLYEGDKFSMQTGGGGGYGDPFEREPERVLADVIAGLISAEQARESYGVVIKVAGVGNLPTESRFSIDVTETERLRTGGRNPQTLVAPEAVPPGEPEGQAARNAHRASSLFERVRQQIADDPCRTICEKQGDPIRCPFHHRFAADFWDADSIERWAARNCHIVREGRRSSSSEKKAGGEGR